MLVEVSELFSVFWGSDKDVKEKLTLHDVVAIGDQTNTDSQGQNGKLPNLYLSLGRGRAASLPCGVDDGPGTDRVSNVVGAVCKGGGAGGQDLDEGVGVLDLVAVLGGVGVDPGHALTLGRARDAGLRRVDVVVETVQGADHHHGGQALDQADDVVALVDLARAHGVVAKGPHGPAQRAPALAQLGVELALAVLLELLVSLLRAGGLGHDHLLLRVPAGLGGSFVNGLDGQVCAGVLRAGGRGGSIRPVGFLLLLLVVLNNGVVGNAGEDVVLVGRGGALEQERALEEVVPLQSVVLLDDLGVDKGDEEEGGQESHTEAGAQGDGGNECRGLRCKAQGGGALVDNGQGADGGGDEEEEWRSVDSPGDGVLAQVHDELDEHEDGGAKAGRDGGSHEETGKDGSESLAVVPTPLDLAGTDGGDTDTGDGRDERVGGRDVGRVPGAPHDPGRGAGEGAGEGEHLHAGIAAEGVVGDDAVLDGFGSAGSDRDGTHHLKDGA